jgi:hypothetical protein
LAGGAPVVPVAPLAASAATFALRFVAREAAAVLADEDVLALVALVDVSEMSCFNCAQSVIYHWN